MTAWGWSAPGSVGAFPGCEHLFADAGYQGDVAMCAAARERLRLEIVKRPREAEGFHLLPRRWVIERTFAWLGRNRRLAKTSSG